jgi:hypothetical protein
VSLLIAAGTALAAAAVAPALRPRARIHPAPPRVWRPAPVTRRVQASPSSHRKREHDAKLDGRHLDRVDENAADAYGTKFSRYGGTSVAPMIAP